MAAILDGVVDPGGAVLTGRNRIHLGARSAVGKHFCKTNPIFVGNYGHLRFLQREFANPHQPSPRTPEFAQLRLASNIGTLAPDSHAEFANAAGGSNAKGTAL
jgi:hypothetical protein